MKRHGLEGSSTSQESSAEKYICDVCGNTYKSKFGLNLHMKGKHLSEFKHHCDICNQGFNQSVQFRFHLSSHASLRLEKCQFCPASFYASGSLKRHLETCQDKSNPFICEICHAGFSRKYKLEEHVRGKHGEPKYSCLCGKRYGWRSSLRTHVKICKFVPSK